MRARTGLACWLCAALLALVAARRPDLDFEFDDADADGAGGEHRPRRYVYDPHNPLCQSLVCKKREVCLLRDAFTALCATKKDILRRGDAITTAGSGGSGVGGGGEGAEDEDEVFYESGGARDRLEPADPAPDRCVGCGGGARAQFLCGSDNRTYSSLCRLDLHNCVRRPEPPVALLCRGFCPCAPRHRAPRPPRPPRRQIDRDAARNEVAPRRRPAPVDSGSGAAGAGAGAGAGCALDRMADRLLDWFSVLQEAAHGAAPPAAAFPAGCKPEVRWMFAHLDADGDALLSARELYALRHDERERCLRPFLASCGGARAAVTRAAWCGCLRRAARPCAALARAARARGGWAPACDARGFYRPRQCHAAIAVCWCVDAHGQELPATRTKGEPPCPRRGSLAGGAPADDEDDAAGGSGDGAPDSNY